MRIASGIAKRAMAKIVKSMPSESGVMPNVCRGRPVWKSRPMRPTARPMKIEMRAFARDPVDIVEASRRAAAMRRKYSVAPKTLARRTRTGERNVSPMIASVPARNDPIAAVASAAFARPRRAIS